VLQKWRNIGQFRRCWYGCQTAGTVRMKILFHNVASKPDGCTIIAVFEVKKEIPAKTKAVVTTRYLIEDFVDALAEHVPDHYRHAMRRSGCWHTAHNT